MDTPIPSQTNSSDYYEDEDATFLEALQTTVLPGDAVQDEQDEQDESQNESQELEPPPPSQPSLKRTRLAAFEERGKLRLNQAHNEDTYGPSRFGDFGEYMRRKRAKLQIQNRELEDSDENASKIFDGVAIYVNGWTQPSVQDLRKLIVKHGGIFQPYLDNKGLVTHIITCSLTPAKVREFKHMKVVRPEWLVQSVNVGTLLPWQDFVSTQVPRLDNYQGSRTKQHTLFHKPHVSLLVPDTSEEHNQEQFTPVSTPQQLSKNVGPPQINKRPPENQSKEINSEMPKYAAHTSNPLAARAMANPEWRKAHTSVAPDFVEGYYKSSRLHHLSAWKAELKNLVQEAQERAEAGVTAELVGRVESEVVTGEEGVSMKGAELYTKPFSKGKGKGKEKASDDRVIMHCDFDCFFVSAGLLTRRHLKGKPVVVCHSQGTQGGASSTSEIASASYEARKYGIRNGMSLQQARKLFPAIITIPYEFERYKQLSLRFYTVLMRHADDLQAVSVDEALIDVTSIVTQLQSQCSQESSIDPAKDFAETIRAQVRRATGCEVSIGISHNILLARLATRRAKPAGSYHLVSSEVEGFLAPLSITDLHGFGSSTKQKAQEKLGTIILGELIDKSKGVLCDAMGKSTGETLYNALRGIDDKKLESDKPRKSVSCDINYGIRFEDNKQAEAFIYQVATEVSKRLNDIGMVGRSITLKIMKRDPTAPVEPPKFLGHGACNLYNKQIPLIGYGGRATNDERVIGEHAWRLLRSFNFDPKELRGIGIQIQKLEHPAMEANLHSGQAMLPFRRAPSPNKTIQPVLPQIHVDPPSDDVPAIRAGDAPPNHSVIDLPSFSELDMEVFNALPADVRKELEEEYQRRSESPALVVAVPAVPVRNDPPARTSLGPSIPSKKITVKGMDYKKVVQQFRPRNQPIIPPQKDFLFKKKGKAGAVKLSDAALRELNIDPEVLRMLPPHMQQEQLTMLRIIKEKGALPDPPSRRKILKPKKRKPIPEHLLWRAPAPRARFVGPPILRQQGKEKNVKFILTETAEIQKALEGWVNTYRRWTPKAGDIAFFTKYLVASVDGRAYTDVSVQRAVAIMKWWLVLLRRHWGGSEFVDDEDHMYQSQGDPIGEAWWKTFREVKEQMDIVARKKFGGRLSLK